MVRPRGKGTTEGWQKHTKSTSNNVSATEMKYQSRAKTQGTAVLPDLTRVASGFIDQTVKQLPQDITARERIPQIQEHLQSALQ